jgi:hypothetical protein
MPGRVLFFARFWHDREMKPFLLILVLFGLPTFALDEDWRVQTLDMRYEDFFNRLKQEKVYDDHREAGAIEVHDQRESWEQQMNRAREAYSRERKAPPDMHKAFAEWSEAQEIWVRKREKAREEYVQVKNHILQLQEHAKKIPGNLEYDLDP